MQDDSVSKRERDEVRTGSCRTIAQDEPYLCPVCRQVIPPEHLGRKVWCRICGYLESCCNPV